MAAELVRTVDYHGKQAVVASACVLDLEKDGTEVGGRMVDFGEVDKVVAAEAGVE